MLDGDNLGLNGQLEWLKQGLLNSTARWKIIFSSVVTNPTTKHSDSWGGFQTEWMNLTNFILDNGITGIVFISGDLHMGELITALPQVSQKWLSHLLIFQKHVALVLRRGTGAKVFITMTPNLAMVNGYGVVTELTNPDRVVLEIKDETGNTRLSYVVY